MSNVTYQNQRQVYGETLVELGGEHANIVVCEADLGKSTMTCLFQDAYPERFFEMGIAEANMTSFAAGLSLTGKIAFSNSFAVFAAGRAYDQIRQGIGIGKLNVKIVGSSAGLSDFGDGATHQAVEDVAIMRAIPNMTVLGPVDGIETRKMMRAIADYAGPVYVRLNRNDLPDLFPEGEDYVIGKSYVFREGSDAAIFANGSMVARALEAARMLEQQDVSVRVINVSTLKPVDERQLQQLARGVRAILTAEEHSLIGGLAAVVTYVLRGGGVPIETIGIADCFGQSAHGYEELLACYGLTADNMVQAIRKMLA